MPGNIIIEEVFYMNEKMKGIIDTNLEALEVCANKVLEKTKENAEDPVEMDKNLRILNAIGCNMERLQRLQLNQPLSDFAD